MAPDDGAPLAWPRGALRAPRAGRAPQLAPPATVRHTLATMSETQANLTSALAGRYTIVREIGAGGMATVFLAHDVRHAREVAIKVLHPDLGAALGGERFLAEIRTTAQLQHPHILPLLDSGAADGLLYYVMPFVRGETLRAALDRERPLAIPVAVRIAREVASALDYAHRQGVIHRDIKPENILLHDGQALVADFGIALAVQTAGGARMTQTGLSLGTPQYMSPEQAMGDRAIDARSDIYALGAVTYEMLTGEAPFTGNSVQAIVAKVLTERPVPVSTTRDTVPDGVEQAVLMALAKLPADRHATAKAFAEALDAKGDGPALRAHAAAAAHVARAVTSARPWRVATATLAVVAVAALGVAWRARANASAAADAVHVVRAHFDLPPGAAIAEELAGNTLAISPDGEVIVFTSITRGAYRMYARRVNELDARELSEANIAGRNLSFSPDGKWIAFTEGNVLRKIPSDGGAPVNLGITGTAVPYGMVWGAGDTLYLGSYAGMRRLAAGYGNSTVVPRADSAGAPLGQRWPALLPDGKSIAYADGSGSGTPGRLAVVELATGKISRFELQVSAPVGVLGDQLVYVNTAGDLMAVRIEPATGRPLGDPLVMESGLFFDPSAGAKVALSASGTLAYTRGRAQTQPVLVSPDGRAPTMVMDALRNYSTPRYSPDGHRIAMTVFSSTSTDVWVYDVDRRTFSRLTTGGENVRPEWTPDGKSVIFISSRKGMRAIWKQAADGGSEAELLYVPKHEPFEAIVSPDAKWLVYRTAPGLEYSRDILAVPLAAPATGDRVVMPLVTGPETESFPRFSPNGKWLVYQSNESGRFEIYVRPFPNNAARVPVSAGGGNEPLWGRDGRSLYYRGPVGEVIKVDVTTGDQFSIGASTTVSRGEYLASSTHANWDIAPDGRILMLKRAGEASQMIVVHNWGKELRRRTEGK